VLHKGSAVAALSCRAPKFTLQPDA